MFAYDAMQTMKQKKASGRDRSELSTTGNWLTSLESLYLILKSNVRKKCLNYPPSPTQFSAEYTVECLIQLSSKPSECFFSIRSSYKSFTWMLLTLILMFTILNSFAFSCSIYHHHQNAFGKLLSYASWLFSCSVLLYAFPFAYWTPVSIQSLRHSSNSTIHNKTETSDDLIKSACTGSDRNVVI